MKQHQSQAQRGGLLLRLRTYLLAGLVVTAPVGITLYLTWLFIDFVDRTVKGVLPGRYNPDLYLPFPIPGFGLLLVITLLILAGMFAAGFLGRLTLRLQDAVIDRMPVIRNIYGALKQILETVFASQTEAFRQVVLLQYPRQGIWSIGFVTGTTSGEVQRRTDNEVVNVFVPTTPNPTSGFLLFVPRGQLVVLDMTVEEGIKMVVSGGIVVPPDRGAEDQPELDVTAPPVPAAQPERK